MNQLIDEFRVKLELGNDAMKTKKDVARALREIADRVEAGELNFKFADKFKVRDENGNTVGEAWTSNIY